MDGALQKTIQLALALGRLILCLAYRVELYNYDPNILFSSCLKKLVHEVDKITISFRLDPRGLIELNTSISEVKLVTNTEIGPETVTTLHKWTGLPPDEVIVQGPCKHVPPHTNIFFLRCTILARCEIGQGHIFLTMDHNGEHYKSQLAKIPKVYPACTTGYYERQVDNYTVKMDEKEVHHPHSCSTTFSVMAVHLLEFCCETHSSNISLEIARDGQHLVQSTNRCVEVNVSIKVKLTEFEFTTHDSCGVRGRLHCQFGFEAPVSAFMVHHNMLYIALIGVAAVILVILSCGVLICIKRRGKKQAMVKKSLWQTKKSVQRSVTSKTDTSVHDSKTSLGQAAVNIPSPSVDLGDQESVTIVSMMTQTLETLEKLIYSTDKDKDDEIKTAEYKERSKLGISGVESSVDDWYYNDIYSKASSDGSHAQKKKTPASSKASSTASGGRSVVASVIFGKNH